MTVYHGQLLNDEALARYTSWRVGGTAQHLYKPIDSKDLSLYLQTLPEEEPVIWLGLGSNVLIRDGGIKGSVIITQGKLTALEIVAENTVRVEAGVACPTTARFCARRNLTGGEFLAGVPGTMGGALAMNAGAFGGETWTLVDSVETIDRYGEIRRRSKAEYQIAYREVTGFKDEWFIAAYLKLQPGDKETSLALIRDLLAKRSETQPTGEACCGSVFRNPPGDYAARLIEASGLKGKRRGKAIVSEKHANFILNEGGATAADIELLINEIASIVENKFGVKLQREVHILGETIEQHEGEIHAGL